MKNQESNDFIEYTVDKQVNNKQRLKKILVAAGVLGGGLLGAYGARKLFKSFIGDIPPLTPKQADIESVKKYPRVVESPPGSDRYIERGWKDQNISNLTRKEVKEYQLLEKFGKTPLDPPEVPKRPVDITSSRPFRKALLGASMLGGGVAGAVVGGLGTNLGYDYLSNWSTSAHSNQHAYFGLASKILYPNKLVGTTTLLGGTLGGLWGLKRAFDINDTEYWTKVAELADLQDESIKRRVLNRFRRTNKIKQIKNIITSGISNTLKGAITGNLMGKGISAAKSYKNIVQP